MTIDEKVNLACKSAEYIRQNNGLSNRKFASMIEGISPSHITYLLKHDFDKRNSADNLILTNNILSKIRGFFDTNSQHWDIENYHLIMNALMEGKSNPEQRIIDGVRGSGKTFATLEFRKQFPSNTYYIKAATDLSPKQFLVNLAKIVGVHSKGTRYDLRVRIGARLLAESPRHPIIIVDEAENLPGQVYGSFKDLYDYRELYQHVSIFMIGANNYMDWLEEQAIKKNCGVFPQFISRFSAEPVALAEKTRQDSIKVCKQYGINNTDSIKDIDMRSRDFRELDRNIKRHINSLPIRKAS